MAKQIAVDDDQVVLPRSKIDTVDVAKREPSEVVQYVGWRV